MKLFKCFHYYFRKAETVICTSKFFFERRQKQTESVIEYFESLSKLARLAYTNLSEVDRKEIIKPVFLRGLLPKIRDQTKFREFPALEDALQSAKYVENQLYRENLFQADNSISFISESKHKMNQACAICHSSNHSTVQCHYNGYTNKPAFQPPPKTYQPAAQNKWCEICNKGGQVKRDCRAPCRRCGIAGEHKTRFCPNPPRKPFQQTRRQNGEKHIPPNSNQNYRSQYTTDSSNKNRTWTQQSRI